MVTRRPVTWSQSQRIVDARQRLVVLLRFNLDRRPRERAFEQAGIEPDAALADVHCVIRAPRIEVLAAYLVERSIASRYGFGRKLRRSVFPKRQAARKGMQPIARLP